MDLPLQGYVLVLRGLAGRSVVGGKSQILFAVGTLAGAWAPPQLPAPMASTHCLGCHDDLGSSGAGAVGLPPPAEAQWGVRSAPGAGVRRRLPESRPRASQLIAGSFYLHHGLGAWRQCSPDSAAIGSAWAMVLKAVVTPEFLLC